MITTRALGDLEYQIRPTAGGGFHFDLYRGDETLVRGAWFPTLTEAISAADEEIEHAVQR